MAVTMTDLQSVTISVGATDSKGNPATVTGPMVWAVDAPATVSITPAADGMSAVAAAVGPDGTGNVTVTDSGDGGLTGTLAVQVVSSAATALTLTAAAPTP